MGTRGGVEWGRWGAGLCGSGGPDEEGEGAGRREHGCVPPSCLTVWLKAAEVVRDLRHVWLGPPVGSLGAKAISYLLVYLEIQPEVTVGVFWPVLAQIFPIYSVAFATICVKILAGLALLLSQHCPYSQIWNWLEKAFWCWPGLKVDRPFQTAPMIVFRITIHLYFPEKCIRDRMGREGLAPSHQSITIHLGRRHIFSKTEPMQRKRLISRWDLKWFLKKE